MNFKKSFQELDLSNAFLFAAAMEDPIICCGVLERILGIPIQSVCVHPEKSMISNPAIRGIRLDVFAKEGDKRMFNVEMQTVNQGDLPFRSRYHQSQIDVQTLKAGSGFDELKESYIIFICTFDPFGKGKYRYDYAMKCEQTGEFLEDGTRRIFLNCKGKNPDDVTESLVWFLKYLVNSTLEVAKASGDVLLQKIHETIVKLKERGEMEVRYLTLEEYVSDRVFEERIEARKEGREEGREEGSIEGKKTAQAELLSLISSMTRNGLADKIPKLAEDETFLEEMKKQFNLV